jgi:hypothetical protein
LRLTACLARFFEPAELAIVFKKLKLVKREIIP